MPQKHRFSTPVIGLCGLSSLNSGTFSWCLYLIRYSYQWGYRGRWLPVAPLFVPLPSEGTNMWGSLWLPPPPPTHTCCRHILDIFLADGFLYLDLTQLTGLVMWMRESLCERLRLMVSGITARMSNWPYTPAAVFSIYQKYQDCTVKPVQVIGMIILNNKSLLFL